MDLQKLNDRLDALEARVAYQDETIEDLNQTILTQWTRLDALERQLSRLIERLQQAEESGGGQGLPEPPPPHY